MKGWYRFGQSSKALGCGLALALLLAAGWQPAQAANPPPGSGSVGLQGTISSAPPSRGATISLPSSGAIFNSTPITVSGLCPSGLLVKVFDNGVFVGSTLCVNGSSSVQVDLFSGQNNLVTRVYDALDQAGPDSPTVTVTFNDAQFLQLGSPISLTSSYAERGAPPGTELDWPIVLSGGTAPYALSVDWGDGAPNDLISVSNTGVVTLKHTYKVAGVYSVIVKASDKNGETAFLQLVGQATGAIQNNSTKGSSSGTTTGKAVWWSALAMLPLIIVGFWLGRRYEHHEIYR